MQVAAMEHHEGRAVTLDALRAEIEKIPYLPRAPEPDFLAGDDDANILNLGTEPQRIENFRPVRRDLHTRPKFLQLGRLLIDGNVDAMPQQR